MNAAALLAKAEVTVASAQALLERGGPNGAVNRTCYAMFDAARAMQFTSAAQTHCFALMHRRSHAQLVHFWRQARPRWRARR